MSLLCCKSYKSNKKIDLLIHFFKTYYNPPSIRLENNVLVLHKDIMPKYNDIDIIQKRKSKFEILYKKFFFESIWRILNKQSNVLSLQICIFHLSPNVRIEFVNFQRPQAKAISSNHHRMTQNPIDIFNLFVLSLFYSSYRTINDFDYGKNFLYKCIGDYLLKLVFEGHTINALSNEERYWALANFTEDLLIAFPDRDSSQYSGDIDYYFRDGIFASAIYNQIPIYETVIVEPSSTHFYTDIKFIELKPPKCEINTCTNAIEYKLWRQKNSFLINQFTRHCETLYKKAIYDLEQQKASCWSYEENMTCKTNDKFALDREKGIKRNKSYPSYYLKETGFSI